MSNFVGITGKDGLIHDGDDDPENQAIIVDDDGVYFVEGKIQTDWSDVKEIALQEEGLFRIELRGGLTVLTGWIHWDEDWLETNDKECTGNCDHVQLLDDDINLKVYDDEVATAIEDVFWAAALADKIRSSEHMFLDESLLLRYYFIAYVELYDFCTEANTIEDEDEIEKKFKSFSSVIEDIDEKSDKVFEIIKSQLERIDGDDEDEYNLISELFAQSRVYGKGVAAQAKLYDNLRNAKAYGKRFKDNELVDVLTSDLDEKGFKPLGDLAWENMRQTIVCTDERAAVTTWHEGLQLPRVMVMDAQDLIAYNDAVEQNMQLIFELGHPLNGVMYVQHPLQKNVYIDMESFHGNMLERKYAELIRLLVALGATEITCEVENNSSSDEKQRYKNSGRVGIDTLVGGGEVDLNRSVASSRTVVLRKKLATSLSFKSRGKPHVPEDMVFYPFEDSWQHLAEMAQEGRIRECDVCLTYSKDYAVTGQKLTSVGAKVRSKVPGYQFGIDGSFSAEFDNELKQLQSTVWHYYVKFGNGDNETERGQAHLEATSDVVAACKKEDEDDAGSSKKWEKALSIGETIISIAKRMREGQIK